MNNKGQTVLAEHVMVFFVVVAALVAMTTYVKRGLQARIHDSKNFVISSISNSSVCDANCVAATNGVRYEYEPYYVRQVTDVGSHAVDQSGATQGNPQALGVKYLGATQQQTLMNTVSDQLSAKCANGGC